MCNFDFSVSVSLENVYYYYAEYYRMLIAVAISSLSRREMFGKLCLNPFYIRNILGKSHVI